MSSERVNRKSKSSPAARPVQTGTTDIPSATEKGESSPASPKWRSPWFICLFLGISVMMVFGPVLRHDFINYDDPDYVTSNQHVQTGLVWESVKWAFTESHSSNWHPVTWISHMLDWQIFGAEPGAHHLVNVLFHAANTILLFLVLLRMTSQRRDARDVSDARPDFHPPGDIASETKTSSSDYKSTALCASAFVAALFAFHPLHVESVAWVAERKDVLSTFFWMLTMLAYAFYVESKGQAAGAKAVGCYSMALLFFALGLMSKPMLVTLPFVLLLLDFWPLERVFSVQYSVSTPTDRPSEHWKLNSEYLPRLFLEKIPFFALVLASSFLTFWAQKKGGAVTSLEALDRWSRISNAIISYPRYLLKMIWPTDLAVLYPHPWKWSGMLVAMAAVFLIASTALVLWQIRKRPFLAVGWFWFLGTLVPVIGLVQVGLQSIADRYTYVPLIGIFIAIAWSVGELVLRRPQLKPAFWTSAALILLACIAVTSKQLRYWENSGTLFSHAVKVTEKNFLAHNNLGYYLYNAKGQTNEAMEHYKAALEIYPQFEIAWNNMGYSLAGQNRFNEAIVHYQQALKINPKHADVHNNLGNALGSVGRQQEAIQHYLEVLKLKPDHADAHMNLGVALSMQGKSEEGMQHLLKAVELSPKSASAYSNLGNALAIGGKIDEAIAQYEIALQLKPDDAQAHNNIGNALSSKNRLDEAVKHYETALKLNADNPEANCNLGYVLAKQGKIAEAKARLQEALRLRPNYPEVQQQLDMLNRAQP